MTFEFSTKASNLAQLQGRLKHGFLADQEVVLVSEWRVNRSACLNRMTGRFFGCSLIVRSSAQGEDSRESSMAGAFESIANVPPGQTRPARQAV